MAPRITSARTPRSDSEATKNRIKVAAQRLFAVRGVDGVSVQEIVTAAGQRNNGSVHYHFGGKDALVRELVADGARTINETRLRMLADLETGAEPFGLRDVVEALVNPVLEIRRPDGTPDLTYLRFVTNVQLNHRPLLREALDSKLNTGYRRCLDLIRSRADDWLPQVPVPLLDQRMSFTGIYANAILSAREAHLAGDDSGRLWAPAYSVVNVIDSLLAVLESDPSSAALELLTD